MHYYTYNVYRYVSSYNVGCVYDLEIKRCYVCFLCHRLTNARLNGIGECLFNVKQYDCRKKNILKLKVKWFYVHRIGARVGMEFEVFWPIALRMGSAEISVTKYN